MFVNIHEAKTNLSKLLKQVKEGKEVIIAKAGNPIAKLVPFGDKPAKRIPGSAKNKIFISTDFNNALPEEVLREFEK